MTDSAIIIAILAFSTSVATLITAIITHLKVSHVVMLINSRMYELLEVTKKESFAAGKLQGVSNDKS